MSAPLSWDHYLKCEHETPLLDPSQSASQTGSSRVQWHLQQVGKWQTGRPTAPEAKGQQAVWLSVSSKVLLVFSHPSTSRSHIPPQVCCRFRLGVRRPGSSIINRLSPGTASRLSSSSKLSTTGPMPHTFWHFLAPTRGFLEGTCRGYGELSAETFTTYYMPSPSNCTHLKLAPSLAGRASM